MEIFLHLGAHRCATTSFQSYLRANRDGLEAQGLAFWGPWRTRNGLLHGIAERPESAEQLRRATGKLHLALEGSRNHGATRLIVSDENMLGTPRRCLRTGMLYPGAGERVARLAQAFGHVRRISLQIRAQDLWWASVISYLIPRGEGLPKDEKLAAITSGDRTWRGVITDIACACPGADIIVTPFERFADRPDRLLANMTGLTTPPAVKPGEFWRNRRLSTAELREILADRGEDSDRLPQGEGRFMPFDDRQRAALRESYADDLFWLEAGADGLATLITETEHARLGLPARDDPKERGHRHDRPARRPVRSLAQER